MLKMLNYCWRVIATGISFTVFGVGGLFASLTVFPYLNLRYRDQLIRQKKTRYIIHRMFRWFIDMMQSFRIFDFYTEEAKQELADAKGKIIIANHPSLIDVVVLISILPQADCIVKKGLWNNFFLKGVVKAAGYIKNDDNVDNLIKACNRSLEQGYCLIIFPEGTRTTPTEPYRLQRGASNIAIRCKRDFIPIIISCNPTTLTKTEKWYQIPERRVEFRLRVGQTITTGNYSELAPSSPVAARRLTADVKKYFEEETGHYAGA